MFTASHCSQNCHPTELTADCLINNSVQARKSGFSELGLHGCLMWMYACMSIKLGILPISYRHWHSNNQLTIKLVKMRPGGTLHVVVGTLKISLDQVKNKRKIK